MKNKENTHYSKNREASRVLIAGLNYSTNLCLARSFGEAGYDVEVLRVFWTQKPFRRVLCPDAYSRYVKVYHTVSIDEQEELLIQRLLALGDPDRRTLLIAADDLVLPVVDRSYELLSRYYLIPNIRGKAGELCICMQKDLQKKLASACGLPVVPGHVITADHGIFELPDNLTYPCFVKPARSMNRAKSFSGRCDSELALCSLLAKASAEGRIEMLAENCLSIRHEYSVLGIGTPECVVAPGFFQVERSGHEERLGVAMTGTVLPCSEQRELIDRLILFVSRLQYTGMFDIDLIEDEAGILYFTEINFRHGASGRALNQCGLNLPGLFADYMLHGIPIDPDCHVERTGIRFLSDRILMDEYIKGYLDRKEVRSIRSNADFSFILDRDDPGAFRNYKLFCDVAPILRLYYSRKEKNLGNREAP